MRLPPARNTVFRRSLLGGWAYCALLWWWLWLPGAAAVPASSGLQFDGSNYVTFGAAPALSLSNVTLEVWFKRTGAGVGAGTGGGGFTDAIPLISKGRGEADGDNRDMNYILAIRAADNLLVADFEAGPGSTGLLGQNYPVVGNTVLSNNVWYHAAATYDGSNWRLYLNGVLETNLFVGQRLRLDSIQHASLASALDSTGAASGAFAGVLDEARIWNYARSAAEIFANYRRQIVSATGLVGRWSLDEGTGTAAINSGSSGVNGTLVNGPVWVAGYPFTVPPTISLTNPVSGTVLTAPTNVLLEVLAADTDGAVTNVSFYAGTSKLGETTNAPFAFTWTNPPVGNFSLTAVATDDSALSTTSAPVAITIHDPVVRITSPTNSARFFIPATVSLNADASDTNGPVALVEFFAGTTKLGEATAAPWVLTWVNPAQGDYSLTAIATDSLSVTHTSAAVAVVVSTNAPPSVAISSPANNASISTPGVLTITTSASDADGTVTNVAFFTNGVFFASDALAPFSVAWTNPIIGVLTLTAVGTDDRGATNLSSVITINVANAKLTRGPYLQSGSSAGGIVRWRTDVATDGRVRYGTEPAALTNIADHLTVTNDHIVALAGLEPDTRYYYSVGTTLVPLASSTNYYLVTSPLVGSNKATRVWVLGDAGTKDANQRAVRDAYYNFTTNTPRSDLILMLGDNAYQNGSDMEHQAAVFDMYTNALRNTFLWSCIGNHDTGQTATPAADIPYFQMFSFPTAGEAGGVASGTEKYYSFDFANIHFVSLDSMSSARSTTGPMAAWLRNDLASTTQRWTIAFWHHPAYTKRGKDSDSDIESKEMRANLVPILEEYGVDLSLVGHTHSYERSILIDGHYGLSGTFDDTMKVDAGNGRTNGTGAYLKPDAPGFSRGSVHCTTGSAGQIANSTLDHPIMFTNMNVLGSVVLDVQDDRLDFRFLNSSGIFQDYFTILKSSGNTPPSAPTNLLASLIASNQIRLTWANVPTNELGFEIERSLDGVNFSPLITRGANLTNYSNGALLFTTTYSYRVRATNTLGTSSWSLTASATTPTPLTIALVSPASNAVHVTNSPTLSATATGTPGEALAVTFFGRVLGASTFVVIGTNTGVLPGATSLVWSNLASGTTHEWFATAANGSVSASGVVWKFSTEGVIPPVVSLTSPANNAAFKAPTNLTLLATASDADGLVTNVEFFAGASKLGEDTTSPYSFAWNNAPVGTYALTAVATDDSGLVKTSSVVNITIANNQPPTVALTSPTNDATVFSGTNLTVTANASDADGTVTQVVFYLDGFPVATDSSSPFSYIWSNAPLGSYLLTAVARDNDGATNLSSPVALAVTYSPSGTNTLVSERSAWRYLDTGSDQGTAWRAPGFNDSAWSTGLAQLGYGDGDEATVVGSGPDPNNRYITTYFRRAWPVADPSVFTSLSLSLVRDDGAVVYLNGNEILRQNMPVGTLTSSTLASVGVGGTDESTFFSATISPTNLVAGTNVLAVEIHQATLTSSDISFELRLSGLSGSAGKVPAVTRGPYLQTGTTNSVIVRWRTDVATNSVVRFGGSATNLDQLITDASFTTEHIVTVSNLQADAKYFYSIGAGTNTLAGGTDHFFVTAPPLGTAKPLRLWVLGDSGTANASARAVRDAYLNVASNAPADLWLMLGDNAYNSGLDSEYQAGVFDMYPSVLRNKVLWPALGNHETAQQSTISSFAYLDAFSLPTAGEAGGVASGTERYYSFDHGNIHFICLDSMTQSRSASGPMANWLRSDLEATDQPWLIAFWHHPAYTKGSHNSDTETELIEMRQNFLPILESYGVDLVLAGHSHCYERSYLLNGHYGNSATLTSAMKVNAGDGREEGNGAYAKTNSTGLAYITAGNSGQATGGALNHPAMFVSLNVLGSLLIDIGTNRLDVQMLGTGATALDHFTITKPVVPAPVFERFAAQGFKARRSAFTDGAATLTNIGPMSAQSGAASLSGDWAFYTPPGSYVGTDTFPFNLSDHRNGSATVNISTNLGATENFTIDDLGEGARRLRFSGIPGRSYSIQYSNTLNNPAWQTLATSTADGSGVFEFTDTPPGGATRFYRSIQP